MALLLWALTAPAQADCVILLHGLARSAGSMEPLAESLRESGYRVANIDYPSTEHSIEKLTELTFAPALEQCGDSGRVHFVTHSMGGILVRQYLAEKPLDQLGRVVMLGPPNQGSEVVDTLGGVPGFRLINGEAGLQLGTGETGLPSRLGPADFDLGIIAGTRSINLVLSGIIPGDDDGKVSVERTKLDGMNDFITLPVSHPFIMRDADAIRQVNYYLVHGRFDHGEPD